MPDLEIISEGTLGSGAAEWTIGSIPQDYQHLSLEIKTSSTYTGANDRQAYVLVNGATGWDYGYSGMRISDNDATDAFATYFGGYIGAEFGRISTSSQSVEQRTIIKLWFGNYSQTDMKHIWLCSMVSGNYTTADNDCWAQSAGGIGSTTAITSITLQDAGGSGGEDFDADTRYCLYGWKV
jgi:hypothetical protein